MTVDESVEELQQWLKGKSSDLADTGEYVAASIALRTMEKVSELFPESDTSISSTV